MGSGLEQHKRNGIEGWLGSIDGRVETLTDMLSNLHAQMLERIHQVDKDRAEGDARLEGKIATGDQKLQTKISNTKLWLLIQSISVMATIGGIVFLLLRLSKHL
ncbi:MAG: hypothetical protein DRG33_01555 [Deltaproteobacteria bacterium]|nr:MAG: hypothetical protein DRG33_01555 [Deltaproteobacteria bacterium]